jgi:ubiquinone/menaquinone biosynthesis C-methylase UbiE
MDEFTLVEDTYNKIATEYTNRYGDSPLFMRCVNRFSKLMPIKGKLLDLGCGSGRAAKHFIKKGFTVVGIDFSEEMLKIAREKVPHADFQKMDMRKLKFPSQSFDGIWSNFSLLHIPKREIKIVLDECFRVLKPNGIFYGAVSLGADQEGVEAEWLKEGEKMFFHGMSKEGLKKYLTSAGFSIKEIAVKQDPSENDNTPILYTFAIK